MNHAVNWEAISAIGQMVGAIGVIISLIYLTREIRKNARSARRASVDTMNWWLGQLAKNHHLSAVFDRGLDDKEALEGSDRLTFQAVMLQWFHIFAEMYYQQLEGELDPRLWHEAETLMGAMFQRRPGMQAWWRSFSDIFGEQFVNYVNQLRA
jgi:hypothetical protein